ISDGTVLRLTGQDTSVALNASLFNGDGTLVNATDGVTLTGELNTNLETDSLTYLADVTVNGDLTNTSGAVSLQNGVAGDTLTATQLWWLTPLQGLVSRHRQALKWLISQLIPRSFKTMHSSVWLAVATSTWERMTTR